MLSGFATVAIVIGQCDYQLVEVDADCLGCEIGIVGLLCMVRAALAVALGRLNCDPQSSVRDETH